ncbi:MAG: hypothetical protein V3V08_25125 [Nannocystaceae bacterium]
MCSSVPGSLLPLVVERRTPLFGWAVAAVVVAFLWGSQATGLVSSNDGSHLALARALVLRGETRIDAEVALTLSVDVAGRGGHAYSDRPPGAAFLALPAVWLGAQLDAPLLALSRRLGRLVVPPACGAYARTYVARADDPLPLRELMGTAWAVTLHSVLVGLSGLVVLGMLLTRLGITARSLTISLAVAAAATLWGPYATTLFSHATAALFVSIVLWGCHALGQRPVQRRVAVLTGAAAAWAVATDYLLVVPMVGVVAWTVPTRYWALLIAGGLPIVVATLAYHSVAFGSPWALGYHFQQRFAFARGVGSTFSGNPLAGLATLLGPIRGAGLWWQAPVLLVAWVGCSRAPSCVRRWCLAFLPWLLLLAWHRTPWGGAGSDHRYLVPSLPLWIILFGLGIQRIRGTKREGIWMLGVAGLGLWSAWRVWAHFLDWHATTAFGAPMQGLTLALAVAMLATGLALLASRHPHADEKETT